MPQIVNALPGSRDHSMIFRMFSLVLYPVSGCEQITCPPGGSSSVCVSVRQTTSGLYQAIRLRISGVRCDLGVAHSTFQLTRLIVMSLSP